MVTKLLLALVVGAKRPSSTGTANYFCNGFAHGGRICRASDVARARAFQHDLLDSFDDRIGGRFFAEVLEHHRARPDLADRVRNAFAVDVGCRTVHGLEHRRELAFRIEIGGWRYAYRSGYGRTQIGENVTEQIRADY